MSRLNIVWFKRDLRVADHRPLAAAARNGAVMPLYIVEPDLWAQPDMSARQWAFTAECLAELREDLAALGQPLCIMVGNAATIFRQLHDRHGVAALWSHEETGNTWTYARDRTVSAWARTAGVAWHEFRQFGVVRRLKSRDGWASAWDRDMNEPITQAPRALAPLHGDWSRTIPSASDLQLAPDPCPFRQKGGRATALATLTSFLDERGRNYRYEMSSPVTAFKASSRLSPHLALGTVSMREVAQASRNRMNEINLENSPGADRWRASLASFSGRQHWHCHFIQKLEDEPRLEFEDLHPAYTGLRPEAADDDKLSAWSEGRTGLPFIDACMRALNNHGWLNFRMRAMLMSFASYHLWLPWRASGLHLARKFVDYEPGIHWPQVQMQSGTTGINAMRIYNPVKQGYDHDPEGLFVRAHVPELEHVPRAFIHEPWRWDRFADLAYPAPVVDHVTAARAARQAVHAVRASAGHKTHAVTIVARHGSRKSGIPMTGRRRPQKAPTIASRQLLLDL